MSVCLSVCLFSVMSLCVFVAIPCRGLISKASKKVPSTLHDVEVQVDKKIPQNEHRIQLASDR